METIVGGNRIRLTKGDITEQLTTAIVNAANSQLVLGGGVAGAIRRKGGPSIQEECNALGGTPVGTAVITGAGTLKARRVIHAVGPRMGEGDEDEKLRRAVHAALELAMEHDLDSIALPAISTGIFGFPLERCAEISLRVAFERARRGEPPRDVRYVLFDEAAFETFATHMKTLAATEPGAELRSN